MNKLRTAILAAAVMASPAFAGFGTPQEFVTRASAAGQAEVDLGKLALQKSTTPEVKVFAQMMIADHGAAGTELATLAKGKRLQVSGPTAAQRAVLAELSKKEGRDFDAAYAKQMLADHDEAVALFSAAGTLDDPELAAFARKTLPVLTHHQEMAKHLAGVPGMP